MTTMKHYFISTVAIPAVIITLVIMVLLIIGFELEVEAKAAPIKREIAQNFASEKWNFNCELARKLDSAVPCPYHRQ